MDVSTTLRKFGLEQTFKYLYKDFLFCFVCTGLFPAGRQTKNGCRGGGIQGAEQASVDRSGGCHSGCYHRVNGHVFYRESVRHKTIQKQKEYRKLPGAAGRYSFFANVRNHDPC